MSGTYTASEVVYMIRNTGDRFLRRIGELKDENRMLEQKLELIELQASQLAEENRNLYEQLGRRENSNEKVTG